MSNAEVYASLLDSSLLFRTLKYTEERKKERKKGRKKGRKEERKT